MEPTTATPPGVGADRIMAVAPAWAKHRAHADRLARAIAREPRGWHTAADLLRCAERLGVELRYTSGDAIEQRVTSAHFCHHRMCPVCSWRKVQAWRRRLIPGLEAFHQAHPHHTPVFLTLTVRNCRLAELERAIAELHGGWRRIVNRRGFPTPFWLRRTEITIGRPSFGDSSIPTAPNRVSIGDLNTIHRDCFDLRAPSTSEQNNEITDAATAAAQKRYGLSAALPAGSELSGGAWLHPHLHALLLVPARYWTADYVKQTTWQRWWMESAKLDYWPVVDIRRGYVRRTDDASRRATVAAAIEAAKYISKSADVAALGPDVVELERQISGTRMIAVSRKLGAYVRPDPIDGAEMIDPAADPVPGQFCSLFYAQWDAIERAYLFTP